MSRKTRQFLLKIFAVIAILGLVGGTLLPSLLTLF